MVDAILSLPVSVRSVDLKNVTVATALRHALDGVPPSMISSELVLIVPMKLTEASTLDYMVENDGLVITTRLNAQTIKETRVYSTKRIKDCKPEEISKVIRQAVRPWSWRSQINDLGEQMRVSAHGIPAQILTSVLQTGAQLVSAESGITVTANPCPDGACCEDGECPVASVPGQPVVCTPGQPVGSPVSASVSPPAPMPPPGLSAKRRAVGASDGVSFGDAQRYDAKYIKREFAASDRRARRRHGERHDHDGASLALRNGDGPLRRPADRHDPSAAGQADHHAVARGAPRDRGVAQGAGRLSYER